MNPTNPIFEFHVIIGNGTNVLCWAKVTNLKEYKWDLSKALVHIFDPLKKKTLELVCDPKRLNESLQPLNMEKGFNIQNFEEPKRKDLKGLYGCVKCCMCCKRNVCERGNSWICVNVCCSWAQWCVQGKRTWKKIRCRKLELEFYGILLMDKFLDFLLKYLSLLNPPLDLCQISTSLKVQVGKCYFQVSTSFELL